MANGKETREKISSRPEEGTRAVAGKSNMPEETLRRGKLPKAEAVRTATEQSSLKVAAKYLNDHGNPKRRPGSPVGE